EKGTKLPGLSLRGRKAHDAKPRRMLCALLLRRGTPFMCAASGTLAHSIRGLRLRYRTARLGERFAHAPDQLVRGERLAEVTRDSRCAGALGSPLPGEP